jgi:hypothetical protein
MLPGVVSIRGFLGDQGFHCQIESVALIETRGRPIGSRKNEGTRRGALVVTPPSRSETCLS